MSQLVKDFSFEKVAFVISDKYKNSAYQKKQQPHFMYYIQWNVNTGKLSSAWWQLEAKIGEFYTVILVSTT